MAVMPKKTVNKKLIAPAFSASEWREISEALLDAASAHHSGPWAERILELRERIQKELFS
jgi:hypothetical protein